jgi:hypothetical protein
LILVILMSEIKTAIQLLGMTFIMIVGALVSYQTMNPGAGMMYLAATLVWGGMFSQNPESLDAIIKSQYRSFKSNQC